MNAVATNEVRPLVDAFVAAYNSGNMDGAVSLVFTSQGLGRTRDKYRLEQFHALYPEISGAALVALTEVPSEQTNAWIQIGDMREWFARPKHVQYFSASFGAATNGYLCFYTTLESPPRTSALLIGLRGVESKVYNRIVDIVVESDR